MQRRNPYVSAFPDDSPPLFLISPFHVADDLQLSLRFPTAIYLFHSSSRLYFLKMMTAITMIDVTVIPPITASMFLIISTFTSPPTIKNLQVVLSKFLHELFMSVSAFELNLCDPF